MSYVHTERVRFGDLDAMRHLNNVVFLRYFETARIAYLREIVPGHDPARPEDVNTESEDHAADEWRYACMSRPFVRGPAARTASRYGWCSIQCRAMSTRRQTHTRSCRAT